MMWFLLALVLAFSGTHAQEVDSPRKVYKLVFEHTLKADRYEELVDWCRAVDARRGTDNPNYIPPARWIGVFGDGLKFLAEYERENVPEAYTFWPESMQTGLERLVTTVKRHMYVSHFDASEKQPLSGVGRKKYKHVIRHTIKPDSFPELAKWFEATDRRRKENNPDYEPPRRYLQVMGNCLDWVTEGESDALNEAPGIWPASQQAPRDVVAKISREVYKRFSKADWQTD
tara:strand:+ start:484 stop:1173 length:690 start_codon:yes stop_codon:yes gene_type:complete